MDLKITTTTLLSGLVCGVVLGVLFYLLMAHPILEDIQSGASPNDFILNTDGFSIFFLYGVPAIITAFCTVILAPFCGSIHQIFLDQGHIFGLNPRIWYILCFLALTLLIDVAFIASGLSFPSERMLMNHWSFVMLGLVIGLT